MEGLFIDSSVAQLKDLLSLVTVSFLVWLSFFLTFGIHRRVPTTAIRRPCCAEGGSSGCVSLVHHVCPSDIPLRTLSPGVGTLSAMYAIEQRAKRYLGNLEYDHGYKRHRRILVLYLIHKGLLSTIHGKNQQVEGGQHNVAFTHLLLK